MPVSKVSRKINLKIKNILGTHSEVTWISRIQFYNESFFSKWKDFEITFVAVQSKYNDEAKKDNC